MAYAKQWGSTHPGCLIILLDQSGSMDAAFGGTQLGTGKKKCDMVATVLNRLLNEFVKTNMVGSLVKPRADIAVLGYGGGILSGLLSGGSVKSALSGPLASKTFVTLAELNENPLRIEARSEKEVDESGNVVERAAYFPIWVEPVAGDGTPMCAALKKAKDLATQWAGAHPDNYPPVVINITDGEATDGDPAGPARDLLGVQTSDGTALLFNCHITATSGAPVEFPAQESAVPSDKFAQLLFSLSSTIPDTARQNIQTLANTPLDPGARGFIFNGDAGSVRQMFIFATVGAQSLDRNR